MAIIVVMVRILALKYVSERPEKMLLLILVLMFKILFTEARVFCEDNNALMWKALGPSCPIKCSTIKSAVDRLRFRDYRNLLIKNRDNKQVNMSTADLYLLGQELQENIYGRRSNFLHPDTRKHIKLYQTYHRLLSNENFEHALKIEAGKMTAEFNKTCSNMAAKDLYNKKIFNVKCTRKLNKRSDALEKFTKFLNVFADPKYPFDEEMAGIILQKLEGNLNLRYGVVDYKVLLAYLRKALKYHKTQSPGDRIIKLQPKNCLNIYQPGCFCKNGFVENQGQCVKPEDCLASATQIEYLERIIFY